MNERVLSILEFDRIAERLADRATSEPGRRMCLALKPCEDISDAKRALTETADAMRRRETRGSLSFGANRAFSETFSALAIGATLDMRSLLQIASFLENTGRVRDYGAGRENAPVADTLTDFFRALEPMPRVSAEIRRCVLSEDEIAPDASPALKSIRRNKSAAEGRIRETMNKMVNGSLREYLQDAVVTMRGDRYCLPVRAEHKSKVNGIVHDQSSSGSTFFIEPAAVVELNNKIREYEMEEEKEIGRILAELSALLLGQLDALKDNATYMTLLDFIFAKASFAQDLDATVPLFTKDRTFRLIQARHPLIDGKKVVPTDIYMGCVMSTAQESPQDSFHMMVITGPNTGGKTVTLKTTGLLTLMGQSGLAIPANEGSAIAFFREIYADIGDEQSIEQSLSTFSSHMTNTVRILREAGAEDLCLFDELGAGTDPTEGAALAIAILNHLLQRGVSVLATTHYAELKVFAMTTAGVKNASCEFDVSTLKPTYRLLIGTPGASNAFAISRKLGLPEEIIDGARAQIDVDKARMETLFADLEISKKQAEAEKASAMRYREEISRLEKKMQEQAKEMDLLGEDLIAEAREEADRVLSEAKTFADETIRLMRRAGADEDVIRELERARTALNEKRGRNKKQKDKAGVKPAVEAETETLRASDLVPGTSVRIVSLNLKGTTEGHPDKNGNLFVQCGVMRMKANIRDLALAKEEEDAKSGREIAKRFSMRRAFEMHDENATGNRNSAIRHAGPSAEINLIGKNTDDALHALDKYLDDAYLSHMPSVRIVHGKGTGTLRSAIRRYLKQIKFVKTFKTGEFGEGDAGVTIVTFKE